MSELFVVDFFFFLTNNVREIILTVYNKKKLWVTLNFLFSQKLLQISLNTVATGHPSCPQQSAFTNTLKEIVKRVTTIFNFSCGIRHRLIPHKRVFSLINIAFKNSSSLLTKKIDIKSLKVIK